MNDTQTVIPPARPQRPTMIRNLIPRLPERGHIKIGELGETRKSQKGNDYQLPVKLSHFRVTTLERGPDGNFVMDKDLHDRLDLGDEPVEIPVRLLYDDVSLDFPTRYACYAGKTLWCSGDGETALRVSNQPKDAPMKEPFAVQCPCHRQEPSYKGQDKCKLNGRLSVLIDGAGGVGGVWVFRTTSYNSVIGIMSSLAFLRSVTGGILANIPLKLRIQPKQATNPTDQSSVLIYVVSVEYAGDIGELQQAAHQIALDRATTHMSIAHIEEEARRNLALPGPADAVLPGDIPEDIVAEFYPETGEIIEPAPPRPTREQFVEPAAPEPEPEVKPEVPTYPVITEDQEEENHPVDTIAERLAEVFMASSRRGRKEWMTASENNVAVLDLLREAGHGDIAEQIVQSWYACDPQKTVKPAPGAPPAQEKAPEATQAPPKSNTPPSAPQTAPVERADFWDATSFAVEAPLKQDRSINFQTLRDKLMHLAAQAQTVAELDKFVIDNERNMRRLREYSPAYETAVDAKIDQVRKGL